MRNEEHSKSSRRAFLQSVAGAGAALAVTRYAGAATTTAVTWEKPPVCVFSKHLQFLDYGALAKTCREIGVDGVDLTVRAKGHVLPEQVEQDLPRAVEAIRGEGLGVAMITTNLKSGTEPDAEAILGAASALGIPYFRAGGHRYAQDEPIPGQVERITEEVRTLAQLAAKHGMTAGYHNHSGGRNFGAPMWDLYHCLETVGMESMGSNFDVGHARVEGALTGWELGADLLAPHVKMMSFKDFVWDGERPKWVRLGEGIVPLAAFLEKFRAVGFNGPISIHAEYDTEDDAGMIEELRLSVPVVREALHEAGYA